VTITNEAILGGNPSVRGSLEPLLTADEAKRSIARLARGDIESRKLAVPRHNRVYAPALECVQAGSVTKAHRNVRDLLEIAPRRRHDGVVDRIPADKAYRDILAFEILWRLDRAIRLHRPAEDVDIHVVEVALHWQPLVFHKRQEKGRG